MTYNLGLIGYRNYNNYDEFCKVADQIVQKHGRPLNIISGGHLDKYGNIKSGTDTLAWRYSKDNNINIIEHEAEWDKYGKRAGPVRNRLIVCDSNVILAFIAPNSVGTWDTVNQAKKNPNIRIYVYNIIS
jgi:hypothetical protein